MRSTSYRKYVDGLPILQKRYFNENLPSVNVRITLLFFVLLCPLTSAAVAGSKGGAGSIDLWTEGAPSSSDTQLAVVAPAPKLRVYAPVPDRANGAAVIVIPGGAYMFLATDREGDQYAQWLSTLGVTAFVLEYRLGKAGTFAPLQDVLRAIRYVRSHAAEYRLNPVRIGVMGSSAGGHLAASASTLYSRSEGQVGATPDTTSARPDFAILMYPVISMEQGVTHMGSRQALIGANPPSELVDLMSVEKQVTVETPPTLLIHSQDDTLVPVENSIRYFQALTQARVPAEMYLFERGSHGIALRQGFGTASDWPRRAEEWLRNRGLLQPARISTPQPSNPK